jgi:hypothetical protein
MSYPLTRKPALSDKEGQSCRSESAHFRSFAIEITKTDMDEPPATRFDNRLRSGGYVLPALGIAAWLFGVAGPVIIWLTNTPIYNRNTGQPEDASSLPTVLFAVACAVIGTFLIRVGGAIRRTYRNGRRSGF